MIILKIICFLCTLNLAHAAQQVGFLVDLAPEGIALTQHLCRIGQLTWHPNVHLTLGYIDRVEDDQMPALHEAVNHFNRILNEKPLNFVPGNVGGKRYTLLFPEKAANRYKITALNQELEDYLKTILPSALWLNDSTGVGQGQRGQHRTYIPHITISKIPSSPAIHSQLTAALAGVPPFRLVGVRLHIVHIP